MHAARQLVSRTEQKGKQQVASAKRPPSSIQPTRRAAPLILQLQGMLGNRRVAQLVKAKRLKSRDDAIGLQRMAAERSVQRACSVCSAEGKERDEPRRVSRSAAPSCGPSRKKHPERTRPPISAASSSGPVIRRVPAPGRDFGTYSYCGFGITTGIPGFIKGAVTDDYGVDYTSGCFYVWANAWDSVWELYDASNRKIDTNYETPLGDYEIPADKINTGTPSDGTAAKWSLWYRVTRSNFPSDNDAYPYDYKTFDVYAEPIKDPRTALKEEVGAVAWQNNFTPAEDGASLDYNLSTTSHRATDESQTVGVSATVSGSQDSSFGFSFDGLTGNFARNLSYSATGSISRTHSLSVSTTKNEAFTFHQPNLRKGVTYKITARPLYHSISGSVQLIAHRDGVITSMGDRIDGGIRMLKGIDIRVEASEPPDEVGALAKKRCWSGRNCDGKAYGQKFSHCHNCKNYASGKSLGEPGACEKC